MTLSAEEKKVMNKVVRYFRSLEEMAAHMGIDLDDLIARLKNQSIHLHLEKKSFPKNNRHLIFKNEMQPKMFSLVN